MMIRRPVAVASAALSVLVFSACSGGGESVPEDAPTSPPASVGEVGGPASEGVGGESTGSALGDASRGDYVAQGMDPGEAVSLDWAGDVGGGVEPGFFWR